MTLTKGMRIRKTTANEKWPEANSVLVYEVTKVNKKTYGLKCVEGYMEGTSCGLIKTFQEESKDVYGTITKWEAV